MTSPMTASETDLRALAAIVSQDRPDLPAGEGLLPPSLVADLVGQIRCDAISVEHFDTGRKVHRWLQGSDADDTDAGLPEDWAQVFWAHYRDCQVCAYPVRTGDLRSVVKTSDFYSMRQWHSTGMYIDCVRPQGIEHHLMLALPDLPESAAEAGRYLRLVLHRGPGPDFSERDRALLVLLRPHLYQACLDTERRRHPVPRLTPRQNDLMRLLAAGHTNTQIARRLGISDATVRTHLEKHLRTAGCLQPHRRRRPRLPGPGGLTTQLHRAGCAAPADRCHGLHPGAITARRAGQAISPAAPAGFPGDRGPGPRPRRPPGPGIITAGDRNRPGAGQRIVHSAPVDLRADVPTADAAQMCSYSAGLRLLGWLRLRT